MDRTRMEGLEMRDAAKTEGARRATGVSAGGGGGGARPRGAGQGEAVAGQPGVRAARAAGGRRVPGRGADPCLKQQAREIARLQRRLKQAATVIDIQEKVAGVLGIPLNAPELDEND